MDRGLETLHADDVGCRVSEDLPTDLTRPEHARAVVQRPQPRPGGVRRQAQALLALAQGRVGAHSCQRVGEDLRDQLQPLHPHIRPVALRQQRVESQDANGRRTPDRERDAQVRLDAETDGVLPVDGGFRGQLLRRGKANDAAVQHLACYPGVMLLAKRLRRYLTSQGVVDVGGRDHIGGLARPLPQHTEIDADELTDTAQRVLDLAVHLVGRQVDEPGGEVDEQRLER